MKQKVPGLHYRVCPGCKVPQIHTEEVCEVKRRGFFITVLCRKCSLCGEDITIKRFSFDNQSTEKDATLIQAIRCFFL